MNYSLMISGIHRSLERAWKRHCSIWKDRLENEGSYLAAERLLTFKAKIEHLYSKEAVDLWLTDYGLANRVINRSSHKKFNPDGSWESNGVRFGP